MGTPKLFYRKIIEEKIGTSKKISSITKDMKTTMRRAGGAELLYSQALYLQVGDPQMRE